MNSAHPSVPPLVPPLQQVERQCGEHGAYMANVIDMSALGGQNIIGACPECMAANKARRVQEENQARAAARDARVHNILGRSGIPSRFVDKTFANFHADNQGQRLAVSVCKSFADSWAEADGAASGSSLVLTGGPGTGKTHLACAIASAVARQHLAVPWFGTVTQLLRHIKDTYRRDSDRSEQDAINDLVEPDLLIIDEIGVQTGSDHEKMLLFEVLNERYQSLRPTILISNLSGSDLEGYIGQRIMDRFRECGGVLAFDWTSHRGQRAA
jgi:DNA replication protein DnaC